jgi:hypothetical protein
LDNILPQAIENYTREMKNYKDLVKSNKNDYSLSDRITLWFNNWTNDFGLNWWKPLASNLAILVNVSTKVIRKTQHLNTLILSKK